MVSATDSFSSFSCTRLATHAGRIDQADVLALELPVDRDGVAGDARFRSGQQAVVADQTVDQGRFARVGAADHGDADRLVRLVDLFDEDVFGRRADGLVQVGHALAVLGRDGDGFAEAQGVRLADAAAALAALGLVGQQDDGLVHLAQALGEDPVQRGDAFAGVHHEHDQFGVFQRGLGLLAHPGFQAIVGDVLVARRVNQRQIHVADIAVGVAPVPGHAGRSSTSARRLPTRRLNSVDLPTLGRPTIATFRAISAF